MPEGDCNCGPTAIPCFGQVVSGLSADFRDGFLPEAVGRNPAEEWEIYCGVRSLLPKEPRCTATAFVRRFIKNAGLAPAEEHAVYLARAAAVVGVLARLDSTLFEDDEVPRKKKNLFTRGLERALWRGEDDAGLPFPGVEEVCSTLLGVPSGSGEKNLRGRVIVRGVYRMMRRHYLEEGDLPAFEEVATGFGITAAMPLFPLCFLTWAQVKALRDRNAGLMDTTPGEKAD